MYKIPNPRVLALAMGAALGLSFSALVSAQTRSHDLPDPTDPKAHPTALVYRSALQHYRALQDPTLRDWRAANQRVHEAGGWRVYLRESQASAPASAASAASAAPSPADSKSKPAASPAHQH